MNALMGWALAAAAVALGWRLYGWQGALLAVSCTVFWLLLQFSRAMRVIRNAGTAPVGRVGSAVMLHSRLARGMPMMKVVPLAGSLGRKLADTPETWEWDDASGARVECVFEGGKLARWKLERTAPEEGSTDAPNRIAGS